MPVKWGKRALAALTAVCLLCASASAEQTLTLSFVGDCTLGGEEQLRAKESSFASVAQREGYAYFLEKVQPLLAQDDLTIANFEGVLKDSAQGKAKKTYCFRGQPDYAKILTLGSVEAVTLANNHTDDYGKGGRTSTREALAAAGIAAFDASQPYVFKKDGLKIAFCGYWWVSYYRNRDAYIEQIRALRESGVNAVICYLHCGQEYSDVHNESQIKMAHTMIEAGADLVIGSHPHVVQGLEVYQNRTIVYSLGNFVFGGNMAVRALESMIARVTLTFDDQGVFQGQQLRLYPVRTSANPDVADYQPQLVTGEAAEAVYARVDADAAGYPAPENQTDTYRDYPYLPAQTVEVTP